MTSLLGVLGETGEGDCGGEVANGLHGLVVLATHGESNRGWGLVGRLGVIPVGGIPFLLALTAGVRGLGLGRTRGFGGLSLVKALTLLELLLPNSFHCGHHGLLVGGGEVLVEGAGSVAPLVTVVQADGAHSRVAMEVDKLHVVREPRELLFL